MEEEQVTTKMEQKPECNLVFNLYFKMIVIHFTGQFDIPCCFFIDLSVFGYFTRPVDLHFGPKKG